MKPYPAGQAIVRPLSDPIKRESHLVVLYGNLAPEGAVAKISGKEGLSFEGRARVFDGEEATLQAILDGTVVAGDVLVVRYEGPRGGPGMREMLSPTAAIMGKGLGAKVALITDGRFSGGSTGSSWGTCRRRLPRAARWHWSRTATGSVSTRRPARIKNYMVILRLDGRIHETIFYILQSSRRMTIGDL